MQRASRNPHPISDQNRRAFPGTSAAWYMSKKKIRQTKPMSHVETSKLPFQGLTFGRLVWILRDGPESAPKATLIRTNCFATKTPWNKYLGIAHYESWAPTKISLLHFSPQSVIQSTLFYTSLNFRHCLESLTPSVTSESSGRCRPVTSLLYCFNSCKK